MQKGPKPARIPNGLDDGGDAQSKKQQNRKRKRGEQDDPPGGTAKSNKKNDNNHNNNNNANLQILPGERMSDFAARVDKAFPLSGVSKNRSVSSVKQDPSLRKLREERQTKHERRLLRMQREWRAEEARLREKEEEEQDEREAENEEVDDLWRQWENEAGGAKKKKTTTTKKNQHSVKKKKKRGKGQSADGDDDNIDYSDSEIDDDGDPWAKVNAKGRASRPINPLEVVQAPPSQLVKPKEKFKVRGTGGAKVDVADIPTAAGSLRRREELAGERQSIVEQYRKLMAEKRG